MGPYKTTNGGINWYYATIYLGTIYPWFYNVSVINNQYCFLPGADGRIFKSTNFGETWDSIAKTSMELGTCSVAFANLLTGWVGGNNHYLFKTTNGGISWIRENTISFAWFSLFCHNELVVWGVGNLNVIMHTTTGGQPFSQISNNNEIIPKKYELYQNYPNPFNSQTYIKFSIMENEKGKTENGIVALKVYDILGKEIMTLINEKLQSGTYNMNFNGNNLASGIYFYSLFVDNKLIESKKLTLLK